MEYYDVIVVGAGPAGGQCARNLAKRGMKVLLAERNQDFSVNSYSSAGAPNEILEDFQLPDQVVGSGWDTISLCSSNRSHSWKGTCQRGVVMDFMKLRTFLAEETEKYGGAVKCGFSYQDYKNKGDKVIVFFKSKEQKEPVALETKILVDATGGERKVLAKKISNQAKTFPSTGLEYLLEVPKEEYQKWAGRLSIFMGKAWMPQGYSWIFPMEQNKLKLGVGRYFQDDIFVPHEKSYTYYLKLLMEKCLESKKFQILDKHGKTIHYTYGRKDIHYDGRVIAIGDAVSTINPLAFEGIRHAMKGANIASEHILDKLKGNDQAFENYKQELNKTFDFSWKLSEIIMEFLYKTPEDRNIDLMVKAWGKLSFEQMINAAFYYRALPIAKFFVNYGIEKLLRSFDS